ncbi:MAG: hypothetical protein AAB966_02800 [Patescibacteria group bacterium]
MSDDFASDGGLEDNFRLDLSQIGDDSGLPIDDAEEDILVKIEDDEEADGEGY